MQGKGTSVSLIFGRYRSNKQTESLFLQTKKLYLISEYRMGLHLQGKVIVSSTFLVSKTFNFALSPCSEMHLSFSVQTFSSLSHTCYHSPHADFSFTCVGALCSLQSCSIRGKHPGEGESGHVGDTLGGRTRCWCSERASLLVKGLSENHLWMLTFC